MKAAMYLPGLRPGSMSWAIYGDFAAGLATAGIDLRLLTDAPESSLDPTPNLTYLPIGSGDLRDALVAPVTRNTRFLSTSRGLSRFLRRSPELDLLYVEIAYPWGAAATRARRRAGWNGALVVTPMGEDFLVVPDASYGFGRFPFPRWALRHTLGDADGVRFISPLAGERLASAVRGPSDIIPLNVAPATVAASRLPDDATADNRRRARQEVIRTHSIGKRHLVLSLGRVHPFKGLHVLVDAMRQVPDADLVIAGPALRVSGYGDYGEFLRRRADAHGIGERVRLVGKVEHDEVLRWLAAADVLAVPSHLESMNRVCVEAAAAGTPFVVSETTGVAGYLDADGVGLVVPPRDPGALATALRRVLGGTWVADRLAAADLVARFEMRRIAPPMAALFERALTRRRAA